MRRSYFINISYGGPRLAGLPQSAITHVVATAESLEAGKAEEASRYLQELLGSNPNHAEVLRLLAGLRSLQGQHDAAITAIHRAVEQRPLDPLYQCTLGMILATAGEYDEAIGAFKRACDVQPTLVPAWVNLGILLVRCMRNEEAEPALRRAVTLDPRNIGARVQLADLQRTKNQPQVAANAYWSIIEERPCTGMAWWGLADLRTMKFSARETERLQSATTDEVATDDDLVALHFALARALDDNGRYGDALAALERANQIARRRQKWNAREFSERIGAMDAAFALAPKCSDQQDLGKGAIFVVSMPRSGSTLIEQILASHSAVEGAGELPDLPLVIAEESRRRRQAVQHWASALTPEEWHRLGYRYLERISKSTRHKPVIVDKMPSNWHFIGAIRAMLPAAHIVVARRDSLETCFSCYRQLLNNNEYTRTFADLASYWRDFDQSVRQSMNLHPANVHEVVYEELVADPESQIRRLLARCGLPFETACLEFHRTEREVRSPSAMQVRKPLYGDTAHSERYGKSLDRLRSELGLDLIGTGPAMPASGTGT